MLALMVEMSATDTEPEYNRKLYDSLLESQKELISVPHKAENPADLLLIWTLLVKIEAEAALARKWARYLPPSYASVLHNDALKMIWSAVKNEGDLPAPLQGQWRGSWPASSKMEVLHYARIRANELGIVSLTTFCETKLKDEVEMVYTFTDDSDFFSIAPARGRTPDFRYNEEYAMLTKKCLIDDDSYAASNNAWTPYALRYCISKWIEGCWSTYVEKNQGLLSYAVRLAETIYARASNDGVKTLRDLPYYETDFKQEWVPNTDYVPAELREAIDVTLACLAPETSLGLGENVAFFRKYYAVASQSLLCKLHNKIAEACVKRDEEKSKCVVM